MAERYIVQPAVGLQSRVRAYELRPGDPTSRPLRVFTLDPSLRKADGSLATVDVPYEPLEPGPIGRILEVECADGDIRFAPLDLENPRILIQNGHAPSPGDPGFHQQMTYAVASNVYASFRRALGRLIAWRAGRRDGRLLLRPHVASEGANAAYDSLQQEIRFGYADDPKLPGGRVFACLSHDVIAHEMTHALIDGLRARFTIPTNPDVLGLHEGLADVVALLHRFSYRDLLLAQIRRVGADIQSSEVLTRVARQLADASKTNGRSVAELLLYNRAMEAHEIGNVL